MIINRQWRSKIAFYGNLWYSILNQEDSMTDDIGDNKFPPIDTLSGTFHPIVAPDLGTAFYAVETYDNNPHAQIIVGYAPALDAPRDLIAEAEAARAWQAFLDRYRGCIIK